MISKPMRPCRNPTCRTATRSDNGYCDACQLYHLDMIKKKERRKATDPFYFSHRWRKISARFVRMHPVCQLCHRAPATIVDHIIERSDGGDQWSEHNLQALCPRCHGRKTADAAKYRREGRVGSL